MVTICLRCDSETFVAKPDAVIEQAFKGDLLQVCTSAFACVKCGWLTMDADQLDELRRRTADAYRRKHVLLTSDAIRALREVFGMNQREFAAFLNVGTASVKRWETWLVQEKSSDELIRLKCYGALCGHGTAGISDALTEYFNWLNKEEIRAWADGKHQRAAVLAEASSELGCLLIRHKVTGGAMASAC